MSRLLAELNHRDEGRIDPWDYLDPTMVPAGPVRVIAVTPQIRERDAAARAARELRDRPTWTPRYADTARVYRRPEESGGFRTTTDFELTAQQRAEHNAAREDRVRQSALKPLLLCANGCGATIGSRGKTGMCLACVNPTGKNQSPPLSRMAMAGAHGRVGRGVGRLRMSS